jgi:uncharacterized ion transporter superfamily protein YfcC
MDNINKLFLAIFLILGMTMLIVGLVEKSWLIGGIGAAFFLGAIAVPFMFVNNSAYKYGS